MFCHSLTECDYLLIEEFLGGEVMDAVAVSTFIFYTFNLRYMNLAAVSLWTIKHVLVWNHNLFHDCHILLNFIVVFCGILPGLFSFLFFDQLLMNIVSATLALRVSMFV